MDTSAIVEPANVDQSWSGLYRGGGLGLILFGLLGLLFLVSSILGGLFTPSGGQALIQYIAANRTFYIFDESLAFLGQVPLIPGLLALYFVLRGVSRSRALFGIAIVAVGLVYGMASVTAGLDLVSLSDSYAAATASQQTVFISAAEAVHALDNPPLSISLLSIGLLVIGPAISKSSFGRGLGWFAMALGVIGIFSFLLGVTVGLNPVLVIFEAASIPFDMMLGYKLYKLAKH